ncbi:hypothetical protein [Nocardia flavorosea]|uniref:hypothetical protein n=1 Tax=Nocardia flavorosea TaxID=53429 RepID=UPI002458746E|nr:hypothetical protein [Nocardia flavorosea]
MNDTPSSAPDSPGAPDTAGRQPTPGESRPAAAGDTAADSPRTADFPGGVVHDAGRGSPPGGEKPVTTAGPGTDPAARTVTDEPAQSAATQQPAPQHPAPQHPAPDGTVPDPAAGEPVYGPPGTGPGAESPVYGYQALGTGIPGRLDVGHALSYGFEKFRLNPGPWIAATSLGFIIYLLFYLVARITEPRSMTSLLVLFAVVIAGLWILQAALVRGALYETDGYRPGFGSYFYIGNLGNAFMTALLAFLATTLASALCLIPGMLVGIGCMFSLHFAVDQGQTPVEAIKSSFLLTLRDPWRVFLLALTVVVVTCLGLLACGFGLLVAGPVAAIAVTYAYRTLTGGPVSPV